MRQILFLFVILSIGLSFSLSAQEYTRITTAMNQLIAANPGYVTSMEIGKNSQNQSIYGMRIENTSFQTEDGTKIPQLLVGVHHGNERNTADLCITFGKNVVAIMKNTADPQYTAISRCVFYVVPVLNISGFNANRRTETSASGALVDPNRDYQDVCVYATYFRLASTQNLANFIQQYNIVGAVTAHGYIGTFTYPWGIYTSNTKTLDNAFYQTIAGKSVVHNNYRIGTHSDIIYPAVGSFEDWAYYKWGTWTMLIELSSSANLENDSKCLIAYFSLVPAQRSTQNQHTGTCTQTREGEEIEGRP